MYVNVPIKKYGNTCPGCGRCETCGRGAPPHPRPWPHQGPIWVDPNYSTCNSFTNQVYC